MNETNPLLSLSQEQKENIFIWLREGSDHEAINLRLRDHELPAATADEINVFFTEYARDRWKNRLGRAAEEADAIIDQVRCSGGQIPDATLVALGQEAFSQITSGKTKPEDLARYTSIVLRALEHNRSERALHLQTQKFHHARRNATEKALDAFAKQLPKNPEALAAFENLRDQLLDKTEHLGDEYI